MLIGLRQFVTFHIRSTALLRGRLLSRILEGSLCSLCGGVFDVRTSGYQKKPSGDGNDQVGYQPNEGQNHNAHDASGAVVSKGSVHISDAYSLLTGFSENFNNSSLIKMQKVIVRQRALPSNQVE